MILLKIFVLLIYGHQKFCFPQPKIQSISLNKLKTEVLLKAPNIKVVHVVFEGKHLMDLRIDVDI